MWKDTSFTRLVKIDYPVIQAGMAGGATTPELVAAVSNAGGLGTLGAGYLNPQAIRAAIRSVRSHTEKPFAVNLFIPEPSQAVSSMTDTAMEAWLRDYGQARGFDPQPEVHTVIPTNFQEQFEIVLKERVPVFSFTFGLPAREVVEACQEQNIATIGTATTVNEAMLLEEVGVDAVCAQGSDAGGHRGTFAHPALQALIGTMALLPQVADAVHIPVIGAGGIMDGRGVLASLSLGAAAAQLGTAFLTCTESGAHPAYQSALLARPEHSTVLTRAFSGKYARGIRNQFIEDASTYSGDIPAYPVQNTLTQPLRRWATATGNPELMSLWAGQGLRLSRKASAADLVRHLVEEVEAALCKFR